MVTYTDRFSDLYDPVNTYHQFVARYYPAEKNARGIRLKDLKEGIGGRDPWTKQRPGQNLYYYTDRLLEMGYDYQTARAYAYEVNWVEGLEVLKDTPLETIVKTAITSLVAKGFLKAAGNLTIKGKAVPGTKQLVSMIASPEAPGGILGKIGASIEEAGQGAADSGAVDYSKLNIPAGGSAAAIGADQAGRAYIIPALILGAAILIYLSFSD